MIGFDLRLYRRYTDLLCRRDLSAKGSAYAGYDWQRLPEHVVDRLARIDLERFLWKDIEVYDELTDRVKGWMGKIAEEKARTEWERYRERERDRFMEREGERRLGMRTLSGEAYDDFLDSLVVPRRGGRQNLHGEMEM